MSRPKTNIDWDKVEDMLKAHCEGVGIASMLGIHPNTFYRLAEEHFKMSFSELYQQKRAEGKELLRKKMFDAANEGDKTMQIWLSKQHLGYKEKQETDTNIKGTIEFPIIKIEKP